MNISRIRLLNIRNYEEADISFPATVIVLYGNNGQGKTNLLEALYTGCIGKSYRGVTDVDLLRKSATNGSVIIDFIRNETEQNIKIVFSLHEKKRVSVNDTKVRTRELFGILQEVMFSPEDLQLIKGNPALRRRFLDMEISQTNPSYYKMLLQYNKAVSQRNILLKRMKYEKDISLHEWDLQLARLSAYIVNKRKESLEKISVVVKEIYRNLTSEKEIVKLTYIQPYKGSTVEDTEDVYYELLRKNREKDIYRQSTSIGPHRDDFVVENDLGELKKFGSQGQQRTAVLALKMAELEFIKKENGEYPILLLDDVMSELDEERRNALLSFVQGKVQTFITTTDDSFFRKEKEYSFLYVEKGKVRYDEHEKRNN